ncbi:hypothetical protein CLV35_3787 [Motilibacter peucedani]|uniref:Uncharacterized protein n=2 Tax=Motilibacter peucedani TaxID=598650 RepID=A0A420XJS7_9ACTN|nr:hypothetical protein CLV35_3787 [Motilibacter peucedani]
MQEPTLAAPAAALGLLGYAMLEALSGIVLWRDAAALAAIAAYVLGRSLGRARFVADRWSVLVLAR